MNLCLSFSGHAWLVLAASALLVLCGSPAFGVDIVAHRGASHDAPENTLAAFELAWEQGADAIETDLHLTRDGEVVAIHDPTTRRTTGTDWKVSEHTLTELRSLDAGTWKGPSWSGQKVPTLAEVLAAVRPGKRVYLEIKCGPEVLPAFRRALAESNLAPEQVVVISFHEEVIAAVKAAAPELKAYWLFEFKRDKQTGRWNATHEELIRRAREVRADGVDLAANEMVDEELARKLDAAGVELHVWTVNDPALAHRMASLGARSITTDRPAQLREALASARGDP